MTVLVDDLIPDNQKITVNMWVELKVWMSTADDRRKAK